MIARALLLLWLLLLPCPAAAQAGFAPVESPCGFRFPDDHGPHTGHKTEWWYYTGSLRGPSGERYGFQFTLFRSRVLPGDVEKSWPPDHSGWRSNQLLLGHAALTDVTGRRHLQTERVSRQAMNLAGWERGADSWRLFLNDWTLRVTPDSHAIEARATPGRSSVTGGGFSLGLTLTPQKGPVAHGQGGYSRKGVQPESASCYYSFPRMRAAGQVVVDGKAVPVTGEAWMDHEYSSAPLEPGILGWDWFSLRLSDGWDLMAFFLRTDKGFAPATSGTLIAPDGTARHVSLEELGLVPTGSWTSPRSRARYPSGWKLTAPGLELVVEPELNDQEMNTPGSTGVNYWEGLVRARGVKDGREVTGEGYVELTGYDKAFTARY